jgi:hypothetical protein
VPRASLVRRRQRLASIGLASIAIFVLALVVLHATALERLPSHMSQFANSRFGVFWALALYCLILGTSLEVWALRSCLPRGLSKSLGLAMLALAAIGAILLATFPADAVHPVTWRGTLHDEAAATTLILLTGSMVVLAPAFHSSPVLARLAPMSLLLGVLAGVALTVYLVTSVNQLAGRGPAQRVLVGFILCWFAAVAVGLWRARDPVHLEQVEPVEPRVAVRVRKAAR